MMEHTIAESLDGLLPELVGGLPALGNGPFSYETTFQLAQ
jgi:hypothetical protein